MTTQLPPRERSETEAAGERQRPDVLFEEARRRRRRRWMAGAALSALIIGGGLTLGMAGGGGGPPGSRAHRHPSGSGFGAGSTHAPANRAVPDPPASERYYTGPGAACPLAPRSRYLPPWSGCVSTMVADLSGDRRRDLILVYSRLGHQRLRGLPPRTIGRRDAARYPALQAMLRVLTPAGHLTTVAITYETTPSGAAPAQPVRAAAAALLSIARVGSERGTIFLQTGEISSGSTALAYSFHRGRLDPAGVALAYGGDAASQAGFQCVAGNPPRLIQRTYNLIRGIRTIGDGTHIYGVWKVTMTRYGWYGPRLVRLGQSIATRRLTPRDTVGRGCGH